MRKFKLNRGDIGRIRKCIAHWKRLRDGKQKKGEEPEAWCCALCEKYFYKDPVAHKPFDPTCVSCPVEQAFGECGNGSNSNPYKRAYRDWLNFLCDETREKAWVNSANRMIRALEKLLPSKKEK